jgi:CHAT domain/Effector-associated domain 1
MADVTMTVLRDVGAFDVLGALFPDLVSAHELLDDVGIPPAGLSPFGPPVPAASWWRAVCRSVANGRVAGVSLGDLVAGAHAHYPGNEVLGALVGAPATRTHRVLAWLAGPRDEARLRQGEEQRVLREAAERSAGRLTVEFRTAARVEDVVSSVLAVRPDVVHFSGHGTVDGTVLFEDSSGASVPVPVEALAAALGVGAEVACVVLLACWSGRPGKALLGGARSVVGSEAGLADETALLFAHGFYAALAAGECVATGFRAGRAAAALHGRDADGLHYVDRDGHHDPYGNGPYDPGRRGPDEPCGEGVG